jgi:hypothetical protein
LSDDEFLQLLKDHVDHGFDLIRNDTDGFKSEDDYVDYLVELTRTGLEQRTQEAAPVIEATPAFGGLMRRYNISKIVRWFHFLKHFLFQRIIKNTAILLT